MNRYFSPWGSFTGNKCRAMNNTSFTLQYPLAFVSNFSQWMCCHTWLYRLLARMDLSELSAPPELVTRGARVLVSSSDTPMMLPQSLFLCITCVLGAMFAGPDQQVVGPLGTLLAPLGNIIQKPLFFSYYRNCFSSIIFFIYQWPFTGQRPAWRQAP